MDQMVGNESFLNYLVLNVEATFHINGWVSIHNSIIWDSQHPQEIFGKKRGNPKVSV